MSAEEDMYVRENFFVASGGAEFWIGLNDIIQEGQFRYVREREISYRGTGRYSYIHIRWENSSMDSVISASDYSNWISNYTRENRESRDCVKFSSNGWRIHDLPCGSSMLPFVCKSNSKPT